MDQHEALVLWASHENSTAYRHNTPKQRVRHGIAMWASALHDRTSRPRPLSLDSPPDGGGRYLIRPPSLGEELETLILGRAWS